MTTQSPQIRLRPLIRDPGKWKLLEGYLEDTIANLKIQLETCDPTALGNLQGQVQSLRQLLNLKATLTADGNS